MIDKCDGSICGGFPHGEIKAIQFKSGRKDGYQKEIVHLCQQCRNYDMGRFRLAKGPDAEFQEKLTTLHIANKIYKNLLDECEEEYFKRFGFYPSDKDDDFWIDSFHVGCSAVTIAQVYQNAPKA